MNLNPLFSSVSVHWATPSDLYSELDSEFHFNFDPCPLYGSKGLEVDWRGRRVYCNPPYGRGVAAWLEKRIGTSVCVYLLPARTDTRWWHDHAMMATEIRFLRGRLKFGNHKNSAPFPSVVLVYLTSSNLDGMRGDGG